MLIILLNGLGICFGTLFGYFFKNYSSERVSKAIICVMGLQIIVMGIKDAMQYENGLENIIYLVVGMTMGEILNIDGKLNSLGEFLQKRIKAKGENKDNNMVKGFVTATLIFSVGSMAILGPLKIALENNSELLSVKIVLDTVMSAILASAYGMGVIFSAVVVVVYQGAVYLLADFLARITNPTVINQISSIGGVLLLALGLSLLFEEKNIKVTNMLPAMFLPVFVEIIKNLI